MQFQKLWLAHAVQEARFTPDMRKEFRLAWQ
jgi:hypothetical protein